MQAAVRTGMSVASFPSHEERLLTLREPSMQPSSGAHHREASLSRAQGPKVGFLEVWSLMWWRGR